MQKLLDLSERIFICRFANDGTILACSDSLRKILSEPDAPVGRKLSELFLPASGSSENLSVKDLIETIDVSPLLVRLAMSNRPCRLLSFATAGNFICWGEVIGDRHTTGLNEVSGLAGQIQSLMAQIRKQHNELQQGLKAAAWLQGRFLPEKKFYAGIEAAWQFRPCENVGGDYFNIFTRKDGRVAAYILDVSGHGVAPAMMGVAVAQSLQQVITNLDSNQSSTTDMPIIRAKLEQEFPFERFDLYFSIVYLEIAADRSQMTWINAGHPKPILARRGQVPLLLEGGGPFIGLDQFEQGTVQTLKLQAGDRIYLYSDGITERRSPDGAFFDKTRLLDSLKHEKHNSLQQSVEHAVSENDNFSGNQAAHDDLTLVALEILK